MRGQPLSVVRESHITAIPVAFGVSLSQSVVIGGGLLGTHKVPFSPADTCCLFCNLYTAFSQKLTPQKINILFLKKCFSKN